MFRKCTVVYIQLQVQCKKALLALMIPQYTDTSYLIQGPGTSRSILAAATTEPGIIRSKHVQRHLHASLFRIRFVIHKKELRKLSSTFYSSKAIRRARKEISRNEAENFDKLRAYCKSGVRGVGEAGGGGD